MTFVPVSALSIAVIILGGLCDPRRLPGIALHFLLPLPFVLLCGLAVLASLFPCSHSVQFSFSFPVFPRLLPIPLALPSDLALALPCCFVRVNDIFHDRVASKHVRIVVLGSSRSAVPQLVLRRSAVLRDLTSTFDNFPLLSHGRYRLSTQV